MLSPRRPQIYRADRPLFDLSPQTPLESAAMAKVRHQFLCTQCGSVHPKWLGKCPDCGTWDSLQEYKEPTPDARAAARNQTADLASAAQALSLDDIDHADAPR